MFAGSSPAVNFLRRGGVRHRPECSPIAELAAAYAFGLAKNHPFVDGNMRIGFAIGTLFLQFNGWILVTSEVDAVVQTLALAAEEIGEKEYACWLEANSKKL